MLKAGDTYSRAGRTTIGPNSFTAVFGMGTGVSSWVSSPAVRSGTAAPRVAAWAGRPVCLYVLATWRALVWGGGPTRPRRAGGGGSAAKRSTVSTGWLSGSPHLHARPIDLVVYQESSLSREI